MSGRHGAGVRAVWAARTRSDGVPVRESPQTFEVYFVNTDKDRPEILGALPVFFSFFKKGVDF